MTVAFIIIGFLIAFSATYCEQLMESRYSKVVTAKVMSVTDGVLSWRYVIDGIDYVFTGIERRRHETRCEGDLGILRVDPSNPVDAYDPLCHKSICKVIGFVSSCIAAAGVVFLIGGLAI